MGIVLCTLPNVDWYLHEVSWRYLEHVSRYRADTILWGTKFQVKVYKQELWFLRATHRLKLIDIYMKFCEDSLNSFQFIKQTQFWTESKGNNSKSIKARAMVLALYTSSNVDIYMKFREDSLNGF